MTDQKNKNVLCLILHHSGMISHDRLLALLYTIDERSVLEIGTPVTTFDYEISMTGPIAIGVDSILYDEIVSNYVIRRHVDINYKQFSEYELDLIPKIVNDHKNQKTSAIQEYICEKEGSLWKDASSEHGFSSDELIDFSKLIMDDELKLYLFESFQNMFGRGFTPPKKLKKRAK